jgi:Protein of unknown function (DUF1360)
MPSNNQADVQRRATYVALSSLFAALFTMFTLYEHRKGKPDDFTALDLVMLGLASYRTGRMVAYDKVFETERMPFAETVPDPTGAGETVVPKGTGVRYALGELISCPICVGTWIAAILVFGLTILPGPTRMFLKIMSGIGLAELINAGTEALQWNAEEARVRTGTGRRNGDWI